MTLTCGDLEDPHKVSGLYVRRPFSSHCGRPVYQRVESSVIDVTQYTSTDMGQAALTETLLYYRDAAPNVSQRRSSRLGSPGTRGEATDHPAAADWCAGALAGILGEESNGSWIVGRTLGSAIGCVGD